MDHEKHKLIFFFQTCTYLSPSTHINERVVVSGACWKFKTTPEERWQLYASGPGCEDYLRNISQRVSSVFPLFYNVSVQRNVLN